MANHAALIRQENDGLDVARRGRNYVEFNLPDGKKRHVATIDPLHIRNTETEIDTAWEDGDGQPYFKRMVKSDYNVYAGLNSNVTFNAGQIIEYRQPDTNAWVKVQPQDLVWENEWGSTQYISAPQGVAAQINDDVLYWPGAYGAGRNFQWQAQTKRLRKDLILDSLVQLGAPPAWMTPELVQLRLQFLFEKSANTQIWYKSGDGEYQLWDEATPVQTNVRIEFRQGDTRLWWFEPAHAYAADNTDPLLLTTRLTRSGNVLFVEIVIPWAWLQTAVYPVIVDPTFTDGYGGDVNTAFDGRVNEAAPTNNYETGSGLSTIQTAGARAFVLFKFVVSSLSGVTVDSATLSLYNAQEITSTIDHTLNSILSANSGWVEACNWNLADGSGGLDRWAGDSGSDGGTDAGCSVSGTDWNASALGTMQYVANTDVGTKHAITLSVSQVQDWIDSGHYGVILRNTNATAVTGPQWASSDHETTGYRPKLVVEYTEAGYTLDADAGAYTLTGQAAGLLAARVLTLDAGEYALTGQAAGLLAARLLAADAGEYALTGQDPGLTAARALGLDTGEYTTTGQDPALTVARLLGLDAGEYALTGADPTLIAARLLALEAGAYTLTGNDPALLVARLLTLEAGGYTLTGQDATLTYTPLGAYTLSADAGSYTLTGRDVSLLVSRVLNADAGVYALTGADAQTLRGFLVAADAGSYAVTGNAAGLALARVLGLDAGAYALTGSAVTLVYSGGVTPTPDSRIYVVAADGRVYVVALEERVHSIAAESRTHTVTAA